MTRNPEQQQPRKTTSVLFVCTGNTCRSPLAAAYFTHCCRGLNRPDIHGVSAGVAAVPGLPMAGEACQVLEAAGIPVPENRSRPVDAKLIADAVAVVAMTRRHAEELRTRFPRAAEKIKTLADSAGTGGDIPDPYGGSVEVYRRCLTSMKPALDALAARLAANRPGEKS